MKIFWEDICLFLQLLYYGENDFRELELSRDSCTLYKENAWAMMLTRQRSNLLERNPTMCLKDKPSQEKQCTGQTWTQKTRQWRVNHEWVHTWTRTAWSHISIATMLFSLKWTSLFAHFQMLPCWLNFLSLFSTNVLLVSLTGLFRNLFYNVTRAQSLTKILLTL